MLFNSSYNLFPFRFLSDFLGHVEKRVDKKDKTDFKIINVTNWTINALPDISKRKSHQTMEDGQSIKYNGRNIFLQRSCGHRQGDQFLICPPLEHTIKTNCMKQNVDPGIWSTLIFPKRFQRQFLCNILHMIFKAKCVSCYILLSDKISLCGCLYLSKYLVICLL